VRSRDAGKEPTHVITLEDLTALVRRELRGKLATDKVIDENTRLDDLGLSSLQVSEVIFTLEEDYGFEFDAAKAADARTVGEVLALANESLAQAADA
jgi:acyl carrier protein